MTTLAGLYRAVVVANNDPLLRRRLLVEAPAVFGDVAQWAEACMPYRSRATPTPGTAVWIMFEEGDASRPVWVGTRL